MKVKLLVIVVSAIVASSTHAMNKSLEQKPFALDPKQADSVPGNYIDHRIVGTHTAEIGTKDFLLGNRSVKILETLTFFEALAIVSNRHDVEIMKLKEITAVQGKLIEVLSNKLEMANQEIAELKKRQQ